MPYCSNCGQEIVSGAKFCSNCGSAVSSESAPITVAQTGSIVFQRMPSPAAKLMKTKVIINGIIEAELHEDEVYTARLPYGNHTVELKAAGNPSAIIHFSIDDKHPHTQFPFKLNAMGKPVFWGDQSQDGFSSALGSSRSIDRASSLDRSARKCPRCGGAMTVQMVSEPNKAGCFTYLLYILLAITILGLLILIPLLLRNKTKNATYAICQNCGYKKKL